LGLAVCLAALFATKPAAAAEFTLHVEPAVAFWVDEPQMSRYTPGFYFAIRPGIALGRVVALQWSYAMLAVGAGKGYDEYGSGHFLLAGIRLRPFATLRPREEQLGGLFVDFNLGYVRTENLNRFGFDAGIGYGFQATDWFSIGPAVRYGQIVQPADIPNRDSNDAQFVTVGVDLAFGPAYKPAPECEAAPQCVQEQAEEKEDEPVVAAALPCTNCPDDDKDGVCNAADDCPTAVGPAETLGCPIEPCGSKPLVVLVQFKYDSAGMPALKEGAQTMDPVLDKIAAAIDRDPGCRVCIMGFASEEGPTAYNQTLSESRAGAVQEFMVAHGIQESRMPTVGVGERCPLIPVSTHVLNRRVEFRRLGAGDSCPTDCARRPYTP
jgi:outer membrane protein OmpA-like peptidoglycan-associated protein